MSHLTGSLAESLFPYFPSHSPGSLPYVLRILGNAKEAPAYAVVESVGPDVKTIKKGDKIITKNYSTTDVKIDNKEYIIVKEEDILATL